MSVRYTREMLTTTYASLERVNLVEQGLKNLNSDCWNRPSVGEWV